MKTFDIRPASARCKSGIQIDRGESLLLTSSSPFFKGLGERGKIPGSLLFFIIKKKEGWGPVANTARLGRFSREIFRADTILTGIKIDGGLTTGRSGSLISIDGGRRKSPSGQRFLSEGLAIRGLDKILSGIQIDGS